MKRFNYNLIGAYFLRGTFIAAPIFFTVYSIVKILSIIDSPVQEIFYAIFGFKIIGIGLITVLVLLVMVGYLGSTILINRILKGLENLILRIPLVKDIYKIIKDVVGAFASDKKKFEKPVLVNMAAGVNRIGFVTNEDLTEYDIQEGLVSVYFPLSYAFTGELLVIDKSLLTPLDAKDVKDLMKFVISGGIVHEQVKN
ncbi:MAG: DUF502 domain-containing protein [Chitinophagales bacterium]